MKTRVLPQQMTYEFCAELDNMKFLIYIENIYSFAKYNEQKGYFKIIDRDRFHRAVYKYLIRNYNQSITQNLVKDISTQIAWNIENRIEDVIQSDYIALKDKLINLRTSKYDEFSAQRPTFYHINCLSTDIDKTKAPRWLAFLEEVLVDKNGNVDKDLILLIQEMFGYCLLNTLEGHSTFFLVGDGNNGKSVMLSVLREMIGKEFSESMSIETITTNHFAPAALIGKKINICVEEESSFVKSDKFKALVSGDPISIEYKYGARFQWEPTVKFVFATNELPTFSGFNEGLLRRIKIIPFNKRIEEKARDTKLSQKLLTELGGIVAWSLEGMRRLEENKFNFTNPAQCQEKLLEFSGNLSSGILFFNENYLEDESGFVWSTDLYEEYKAWAERMGKKKQSYYSFFKDLDKVLRIPRGRQRRDEMKVEEFRKVKSIHTLKTELPEF